MSPRAGTQQNTDTQNNTLEQMLKSVQSQINEKFASQQKQQNEMKANTEAQQKQMKEKIDTLQGEMQAQQTEMKAQQAEMREKFDSIQSDIKAILAATTNSGNATSNQPDAATQNESANNEAAEQND